MDNEEIANAGLTQGSSEPQNSIDSQPAASQSFIQDPFQSQNSQTDSNQSLEKESAESFPTQSNSVQTTDESSHMQSGVQSSSTLETQSVDAQQPYQNNMNFSSLDQTSEQSSPQNFESSNMSSESQMDNLLNDQPVSPNSEMFPNAANSSQPSDGLQNQPNFSQNNITNQSMPQKPKKKTGLIIGCIVGGVAVVAAAVVILLLTLNVSGKTVTCKTDLSEDGDMDTTGEIKVNIKDGEIVGGEIRTYIDLRNLPENVKEDEESAVEDIKDSLESQCSEEYCEFSYEYKPGESADFKMTYNKDGSFMVVTVYNEKGKSDKEIADSIQKKFESNGMVCEQH